MPQERSLQKRILVPTHLVGRKERPFWFWRPQRQQSPRAQVKAQERSQESKDRQRKKEALCLGKEPKTDAQNPRGQVLHYS